MNTEKKKPSKALIIIGALVALALGRLAYQGASGTSTADRSAPAPVAAPASTPPAEAPKQAPLPSEPQPAAPPAAPTQDQLAIDAAYDAAHAKDPSADAYERAARKLKLLKADVLEAVSAVAEYRGVLLTAAKRSVVTGVGGDLDIKSIARTDLGTHTAIVSFTAVRCPEGDPRRDKDLELLATTALKTIATSLPEPIDSFRASLWYRGISCERGSLGYGATWTRAKNKLTLE